MEVNILNLTVKNSTNIVNNLKNKVQMEKESF